MPGQLVIIVVVVVFVVVVAAAVFTVVETMYHAIFVAQGKEPIFFWHIKAEAALSEGNGIFLV